MLVRPVQNRRSRKATVAMLHAAAHRWRDSPAETAKKILSGSLPSHAQGHQSLWLRHPNGLQPSRPGGAVARFIAGSTLWHGARPPVPEFGRRFGDRAVAGKAT